MISAWTQKLFSFEKTATSPLAPSHAVMAFVLFAYPALAFTVRGGVNGSFALLALMSLYALVRNKGEDRIWDGTAIVYAAAMASMVIAVAVNQVVHGYFVPGQYDGPSRFLFAVLIYLVLRRAPISSLTVIQYGFSLAAIASVAVLWWAPKDWSGGRLGSYFLNPIHYGDLALIAGALAFLSADWTSRDSAALRSLKWLALLAGIYASLLTGSRGGWLALPVLFGIWAYKQRHRLHHLHLTLVFVGILAAAAALYAFVPQVQERIDLIHDNVVAFQHGNYDTSIGLRLQIWKAVLLLFWEHPLFGVGFIDLKDMMIALGNSGVITPLAVEMGLAEIHNEVLAATVKLGLFGLVGALSVYLVPLVLFLRLSGSTIQAQRVAAILGLATVSAFVIFGLTVEIFNLKMTVTFYSLTVAVLLAIATHRDFECKTQREA
jgi:O-antigen ligase